MKIFDSNSIGIIFGISSGSFVFYRMLMNRSEKIKIYFNEEMKNQKKEFLLQINNEISNEKNQIRAQIKKMVLEKIKGSIKEKKADMIEQFNYHVDEGITMMKRKFDNQLRNIF